MDSPILRKFVEERRVEGSLLAVLEELCPDHRESLEFLIEELRPSANTFRDLIELVKDISARERKPIAAVLSKPLVRQFLGADEGLSGLSAKDKQKRLRFELEKRRFPERTRITERLALLSLELRKSYGVDLELPEDLEGDTLVLSLKIRSPEQCELAVERLREFPRDPRLKEIYDILLGDVIDQGALKIKE